MTASTPITDWGPEHGEQIAEWGQLGVRRPNPVNLFKVEHAGTVRTDRGITEINTGDYIAHDPETGQVWPVSASYIEKHYELGLPATKSYTGHGDTR